jgi:hypothetical protein
MVQERQGDDAQEHPLAAGEPPPQGDGGLAMAVELFTAGPPEAMSEDLDHV